MGQTTTARRRRRAVTSQSLELEPRCRFDEWAEASLQKLPTLSPVR